MHLLEYLQSQFLLFDRRFRCEISYLIVTVNRYEKPRLISLVNLYLTGFKCSSQIDKQITVGELRNMQVNSEMGQNSVMFLKTIRGTAAYWKDELFNILARMRTLGPPDLFLTFSVDDIGWKELNNVLLYDLCTDYVSQAESVRKDPVIVALYSDRRFRAILQFIKDEKPLGTVIDYYARVEIQNRGSPHFHLFLWAKDIPSLSKGNDETEIVTYINKIIDKLQISQKRISIQNSTVWFQGHRFIAI